MGQNRLLNPLGVDKKSIFNEKNKFFRKESWPKLGGFWQGYSLTLSTNFKLIKHLLLRELMNQNHLLNSIAFNNKPEN